MILIKSLENKNKLSSVYDCEDKLWVIAYSDGHGTIELANETIYPSEKLALGEAQKLNSKPNQWVNDELFVIPMSLTNTRISVKTK